MGRGPIIAGRAVIIVQAQDNIQKSIGGIRASVLKMSNSIAMAGDQAMRGGLLGSIASGYLVKKFADFESSMLFLQTKFAMFGRLTGNNAKIMEDMEKTIRDLGSTTSYTAGEVAEAAVKLAQANLNPTQVTDSLGAVLDLAKATRTELPFAADAIAKVIKTFKLSTKDMPDISSMFVAATRLGPLDLEDLMMSLRYSQSTGMNLKQSLPQMLAIFAEMSNKGMQSSIAGTSLNTAMGQISKKFQEMEGMVPNFKVMYDEQGMFSYIGTLQSFINATKDMDVLSRQALTQDVFNLRGARSVGASEDVEQIIKFYKEIVNSQGEAAAAAKTMDSGTTGAIMRLSSAFDELVLAGGKVVSQVLIPFFETTSKILNQLSTLVPQYKGFVATMLLIPPVTLAGGIGLIMLAKGLRTVAGILGVVRSGFNAVFGSFAKGTSGQISAAIALYKSLRGKMGSMELSVPKLGIGNAVRGAAGAVSGGINRASTAIRATATISANKKSLESILKIYRYEKLILDIKKRRGIATAAEIARQAQLVKGIRNSITALRLSTRLAVGARSTALGAGALKNLTAGKVLAGVGKGIVTVARGLMTLTRVTLQFGKIGFRIFRAAFSVTGLWTIAEILILFGDKIPFVKDVLADFGRAFAASFAAIGRVAQYAKGPLALIGAGIGAVSDGFTAQGVDAIITGVSNLAGIIRNQLISAWNLFFAKLGETWNVIRGIGTAIWEIFTSLYNSISSILGSLFSLMSDATGIGGQGTGKDLQQGIYGWIKYFVTEGSVLVSNLVHGIALLVESLRSALSEFIYGFRSMLEGILERIPLLGFSRQNVEFTKDGKKHTMSETEYDKSLSDHYSKKRIDDLNKAWTKTNEDIRAAFSDSSPMSQAVSDMMERNSQALSNLSYEGIQAMYASIREEQARIAAALTQQQEQPGLGGFNPRNQRREVQNSITAAMVGYSSAIIGNIIKYGKAVEESQLDVLEEIRDDQRQGLKQRGGVLLGP